LGPLFADTSAGPLADCNKTTNDQESSLEDIVNRRGESLHWASNISYRSRKMILLLGYLASLFATFVVSAAVLSAILIVTKTSNAPGHPFQSHLSQLSKHEPNKHGGNSRVARAATKDKSTSIMADAGRLREIPRKEVEKP
jgi:hypothetical protein